MDKFIGDKQGKVLKQGRGQIGGHRGKMRLVTGCSGIEGIGIAGQWAGMEIVGQIEIDDFCNKVLEKYWPTVKRMKNLFDVRGDEFGAVDIFAAGIPCQPFSHAGKRKGSSDDRYLWPETIRIIRTMQPTWIIIENVDGIGTMEQSDYEIDLEGETTICTEADMVLETIRKDFENTGYETLMLEIPACAVGARHRRDRYFIVGYSNSIAISKVKEIQGGQNSTTTGNGQTMGNSERSRCTGDNERRTRVMANTESDNEGRMCGGNEKAFTRPTRSGSNVADTYSTGCEEFNIIRNESRGIGATQSGLGGNSHESSYRLHKIGGIEKDANEIRSGTRKVLRLLRGEIKKANPQERKARRYGDICKTETLQPSVCSTEQNENKQNSQNCGTQEERCKTEGRSMRDVREEGGFGDASQGLESREQQTVKCNDAMCNMSHEMALGKREDSKTETEKFQLQNLRETCSEIRHVPNALPKVQEIWRPESNKEKTRFGIYIDKNGVKTINDMAEFIRNFPQPAYMGQPQHGWEPPRTTAGVRNRTRRLKALGNAVDPLQIYSILQIIYWIETGLIREAMAK